MNEKDLERLRNLRSKYVYSEMICDPVEYLQRKKDMIGYIVAFLLKPLEEFEQKERENGSED